MEILVTSTETKAVMVEGLMEDLLATATIVEVFLGTLEVHHPEAILDTTLEAHHLEAAVLALAMAAEVEALVLETAAEEAASILAMAAEEAVPGLVVEAVEEVLTLSVKT
jgi:hypothetical protein